MLRSIGKQSGESVESVSPEEAKVGYCGVEGFAEKESFKPGRAALTGKHDTLVRRAPGWPSGVPCQSGALRIHLTRLSTEGLGPRHGEVRRAHQMLNAALKPGVKE